MNFLILLFGLLSQTQSLTPFANGSWPVTHHDSWNSDASPYPGPRVETSLRTERTLLLPRDLHPFTIADPISLVTSSSDAVIWASSINSVVVLSRETDGSLVLEAAHYRDFNFEFHGAYALAHRNGLYYTTSDTSIQAYFYNSSSKMISVKHNFSLASMRDGEHLIGLSALTTDNADLVYCTSYGLIGVIQPSLTEDSKPVQVQLPGLDNAALPSKLVSNSFAVDDSCGIYVVTSVAMNKVIYTEAMQTLGLAWSTSYSDGQDPWLMGRLGPGSGSSPTLMAAADGDSEKPGYVIITDGRVSPMRILAFHAGSGDLMASDAVDFGDPQGLGATVTSEQSVVVAGKRALVVNNYVVDQIGIFCGEVVPRLPINDVLLHSCPMMFGKHAFGMQQFELSADPANVSWLTKWSNADVSCTSSIPGLSTKAPMSVFCLGHRGETFTLESIDWDTGKSLWHKELGHSLAWNSQYAGTEIGAHDDVIMGTLTGILRVTTKEEESSSKKMDADDFPAPKVVIDLQMEPEDRWDTILRKQLSLWGWNATFGAIIEDFESMIPGGHQWFLDHDDQLIKLLDRYPEEYAREIQGMYATCIDLGHEGDILLGQLAALQLYYEMTAFCTGIIVETPSGEILHGRNMDYGLPGLKGVTVDATFKSGDVELFRSTSYIGYVGVVTGARTGASGWGVQVNQLFVVEVPFIHTIQAAINGAHSIGFALRNILYSADSFQDALAQMKTVPLMSDCYLILSGQEPGEGAIITRDRDGPDAGTPRADGVTMLGEDGGWYLVETNFRPWGHIGDGRKIHATKMLDSVGQEGADLDYIYTILSTPPVLAEDTVYTVKMHTLQGSYDSTVRSESEDPRWVALQNVQEAVDDGSISANVGYRAALEILNN